MYWLLKWSGNTRLQIVCNLQSPSNCQFSEVISYFSSSLAQPTPSYLCPHHSTLYTHAWVKRRRRWFICHTHTHTYVPFGHIRQRQSYTSSFSSHFISIEPVNAINETRLCGSIRVFFSFIVVSHAYMIWHWNFSSFFMFFIFCNLIFRLVYALRMVYTNY